MPIAMIARCPRSDQIDSNAIPIEQRYFSMPAAGG
jgi:hypothetical protein